MLDERIIEKLVERLANRIEKGNTYLLKEIAECIKQIGSLTPSKAQQLAQMLKYGGNYQRIAKELARYTELNVQDIYDIFDSVAKENQLFAKQFYDYRDIRYIPYEQNIALQNQVRAIARITAKQYVNLSNTLAFATVNEQGKIQYTSLSETYQKAIDEAVLNISQGKESFNQQMRKTLKQLGQSGIRTVDYASGYSQRLDSAVRMNMQGALRDLSNTLQKQFGEEYGADGIEISVHEHPAPDHAPIQGHQFTTEEYYKMQSSLPFKDVNGKYYTSIDRHIGEWNCYHYEFSIIVGVSQPNYAEKELQEILDRNEKGFEFEGEHYSLYQGTQLQRRIETNIRKQKDIQIMARKTGDDELANQAQLKINQYTDKYNNLSIESGLKTKIERLRVEGYRKIKTNIENSDIITPESLIEKLNINLEEYNPFENNIQEKASNIFGYDSKPTILNQNEYIKNDGQELIRVVHNQYGKTAQEAYNNTLYGDIKYSEFYNSTYGRGIYFGESISENQLISGYGKSDYKVIRAKMPKSYKILEFKNQTEYIGEVSKRINKLPKALKEFYTNEQSLLFMIDGYDGIKIKSNGYYCIYNRGGLLINE